ncbi:CoA-binding protein [Dongia sp.]|uniref:CoA-binding protein n=1 Tax=Dongia sp. TaxID=1977262 RepID=UPI0035B3FB5B
MTTVTDDLLRRILRETKIIALVGASPRPERPSHGVMRFLQQHGYRVIPVNPGIAGKMLNDELVYARLADIPEAKAGKIDMVDIFRNSDDALAAAREAIEIGARTVWMQLNVVNETAAQEAEAAGLRVVMDRCPAIEIPRLFGGRHEA